MKIWKNITADLIDFGMNISITSISFYFVTRLSRVQSSKECVVMDICISRASISYYFVSRLSRAQSSKECVVMDICTSIASISFYFVARFSWVRSSMECVVMEVGISGMNRIWGGVRWSELTVTFQVTNYTFRYIR